MTMITTNGVSREMTANEQTDFDHDNEACVRLRKIVSREPGFAVAVLGDRCEGVVEFWGAPIRTVIVRMVEGDSLEGTLPLNDEDYGLMS